MTSSQRARHYSTNPCRSSSAASWNGLPPVPPSACDCKAFAIASRQRALAFFLLAFCGLVAGTGRDGRRGCVRAGSGP